MLALSPGTHVDRYELLAPIGEGGMAEVWVARQKGKHGFEKLFAFKRIHPRFANDPAFRAMFLEEARIASAITHPNVAQVFDLGESGSMLYLVMEYVDGQSLAELIAAAARTSGMGPATTVPTPIALQIVADVCAGLHAAHSLKDAQGSSRGIVHRDVSPHNILISVRGEVKVIDFGIALAKDRTGIDTGDGSVKGKLHYMAPEQVLREELGPFTDVFSTGVTLYRMLAGRPAFDGGNDAATLHRLLSGAPPDPLPYDVPPTAAAIVHRALSREPTARYPSALAMQTDVEAVLAEIGHAADVASWASANTGSAARERRQLLAARAFDVPPPPQPRSAPAFVAELGLASGRTPSPARADAPPVPPPAELPRAVESAPRVPVAAARARAIDPAPAFDQSDDDASDDAVDQANGPGMLDVHALIARESRRRAQGGAAAAPVGASSGSAPNATETASASASTSTYASSTDDYASPAQEPTHVGPATPARPEISGPFAGRLTKIAIGSVIVIISLVVALLVAPSIVRNRIILAAREAGVELTIERVGLGLGGVTLRGITARVERVPGATVRADEIFAAGISAPEVRVRGLAVKLEGSASDVGPALMQIYQDNRARFAGAEERPRRVSVIGASLSWVGALGEGTRIDASEIGTEIESHGVGTEEIRGTVGRAEITTKRTVLGPWACSFDENATTSRLRVLFDPAKIGGPSALAVWGKAAAPHLTVNVPRSSLSRLGLRPKDFGVDDSTAIEAKLEGGRNPNMRIEGYGRVDLFGVSLAGLKSRVDVSIEGNAAGMPGKPLDLEKTTAIIGPFVANVNGTLTGTDHGFRVDAFFRTQPIACEKLARAEAKSMGPLAAALQELAQKTRVARVIGTAQVSGVVTYDTKRPDEGAITVRTREMCGLSIFGL